MFINLLAEAPNPNLALLVDFLTRNGVWVMIIGVVVIGVGMSTLKDVIKVRARERSRREIAAYIAEGSMSPEQGERLMRSGSASADA